MAQPTGPAASASPPASSGSRSNDLFFNGKFIVALFVTAVALLPLLLIADIFAVGSFIVLAVATCALAFRLRLITRFVIAFLASAGVIIVASGLYLGEPFYDSGMQFLNSYTDLPQKEWWSLTELPPVVAAETSEGIRLLDASDPRAAEVLSAIKEERGGRFLMAIGAGFVFIGLLIACFGMASRLMGITKEPVSASGQPGLFSRLGRSTKAGLAMIVVGFLMLVLGPAPQDTLDYINDVAPLMSSEATHLEWPFEIGYIGGKIGYIGGAFIWSGLALLAFPLVKLVWYFVLATRDPFRVLGFAMVVVGVPVTAFAFEVLPGFIIPTVRESFAPPDNTLFLSSFTYYPGWLRTIISILNHLGPICIIAGIVFIVLGRHTLPILGGLIAAYFESWFRASGGGSSESVSSSSSSNDSGPPTRFDGRPR